MKTKKHNNNPNILKSSNLSILNNNDKHLSIYNNK